MSRQYLCKKDPADSRDFHYKLTAPATNLPESVDLRPKDVPLFNQGSLGSCTANAICSFKEFIDKAGTMDEFFNLSRLDLYRAERSLEGTVDTDSGAYIRDGFKVLQQRGVCGESFFPYVEADFAQQPSQAAEENAAIHKINEYWRIITTDQLKESLANGYPVVLGIDVYQSFEDQQASTTGYIPVPQPNETLLGGHAVKAVGYNPTHCICKNSWGPDWGDKGYFYLPWEYFTDHVNDLWTGR